MTSSTVLPMPASTALGRARTVVERAYTIHPLPIPGASWRRRRSMPSLHPTGRNGKYHRHVAGTDRHPPTPITRRPVWQHGVVGFTPRRGARRLCRPMRRRCVMATTRSPPPPARARAAAAVCAGFCRPITCRLAGSSLGPSYARDHDPSCPGHRGRRLPWRSVAARVARAGSATRPARHRRRRHSQPTAVSRLPPGGLRERCLRTAVHGLRRARRLVVRLVLHLPYGSSIAALHRRLISAPFDDRLGVHTAGHVSLRDLDLHADDRVDDEPSGLLVLRRALRKLDMTESDVFVDFGSGKGRIVLQAAMYPFRRVLGVEISPYSCTGSPCRTCSAAGTASGATTSSWANSAAEEFDIPDDLTVAYFFNPFHREWFSKVIRALITSSDRNPRPLWIIYHNARGRAGPARHAAGGSGVDDLVHLGEEPESGLPRGAPPAGRRLKRSRHPPDRIPSLASRRHHMGEHMGEPHSSVIINPMIDGSALRAARRPPPRPRPAGARARRFRRDARLGRGRCALRRAARPHRNR